MQIEDLKLLWMFTLRIGMYTGKENEGRITSFLHGYEAGRNKKCQFTEKLSSSIEKEFSIESRATGWSGQIERTAQKLGTEWVTIFKRQSLKVLTEEFPDFIEEDLIDSLKERIIGKMRGVNHHFRKDWITDWFGIVDLSANWFRSIWTKKELKLISDIEEELKLFGKVRKLKKQIKPTERLKGICGKLLEEINKRK